VTVRDILGVHTLSCCLPVLPVFFFFFLWQQTISTRRHLLAAETRS
jgi:hypothetical protein